MSIEDATASIPPSPLAPPTAPTAPVLPAVLGRQGRVLVAQNGAELPELSLSPYRLSLIVLSLAEKAQRQIDKR
jgi:hypothetical protein